MPDSKELKREAQAATEAASALVPEVESTQARLAQATTAMEQAEQAYNMALESEASGTPADVEGLESQRNLARRAWQGLGSLAGRLASTMAGHRDRADAKQIAAKEARRAERAALAMERVPELTDALMATHRQVHDLSDRLFLERSVLEVRGPWAQAAELVLQDSAAKPRWPEPPPFSENMGERVARELEL